MAKKSIGDLHATVTADAVQFVSEFKRADNEARRASASIKKTLGQQFGDELGKTGKKFALGFLGAAALGAVVAQVKDVSRNIDSIPGVPADTIESIRTMNYAFAQTGRSIDQATAKIVGGISRATQYAGGIAAAILTGGSMADVSEAIGQLNKEAEAFARSGFNKQMGELNAELERLNQGFKGGITDDLDREANALAEFAETGIVNLERYRNAKLEALSVQVAQQGGATQADLDEAALQAIRNRIKVQQEYNNELKEYEQVLNDTYDARQQDTLAIMGTAQALDVLNAKLAAQRQRFSDAVNSADGLEKTKAITKLTKDISDTERQIFKLVSSVRTASQEITSSFSSAFDSLSSEIGDFAVDGEFQLSNFTDSIVRNVASTVAKLAVINPILNTIFGSTTGWQTLGSFWGKPAAEGGYRDGSKPYLVGEEGPEVFNPGRSGTITPNHELQSGGGAGETNVYIDATGADVAAVNRLSAAFSEFNTTFERRAVGAVSEAKRRGGGMAKGL